jgi:hypothetical protein
LNVFKAVPGFEKHIVAAIKGCNLDSVNADVFDQPGECYTAARSQFCANFRKAAVVEKKKEEAAKIDENIARQASDPRWGMF